MIFRCDEIINGESLEILLLCVVQGYINKTDSFVGVNVNNFDYIVKIVPDTHPSKLERRFIHNREASGEYSFFVFFLVWKRFNLISRS